MSRLLGETPDLGDPQLRLTMSRVVSLFSLIRAWVSHERFRLLYRWLGRAMIVAIFCYLGWRLTQLGWENIWAGRPTSPLFYGFVLLSYLLLPCADALIYARLWRLPYAQLLPATFRKRVFNFALMGYSGELFLLTWALRHASPTRRDIMHDIKDVNLLSAIVSTAICAVTFLALILHFGSGIGRHGITYAAFALTFPLLLLSALGIALRSGVLRLSRRATQEVLIIHSLRFLGGQMLLLAQWHAAIPDLGITNLLTLLAVQMAVARLPLLPDRDLLFISMGIGLAGSLAWPQAAVAGLLIVSSAIQQFLNLLFYAATTFEQPRRQTGAEVP